MSNMKIIQLQGLPASGKSFYTRELMKDLFGDAEPYIRLNKDDIRATMFSFDFKRDEKLVVSLLRSMAEHALSSGRSVIDDNTNFNPSHIRFMEDLAKKYNAEYKLIKFDTPVWECIERDSKRENSVGAKVIIDMWNKYLNVPNSRFKAEIQPDKYHNNIHLPHCIIVDIDGTIAKANGRSMYDVTKVYEDLVHQDIRNVILSYQDVNDLTIFYMSGREDSSQDDTYRWLEDNGFLAISSPIVLLMRKAGDNRKDSIVKKELFDKYIKDNYHVDFVIDDRSQVVDMWRNVLGLRCLQVADGDF